MNLPAPRHGPATKIGIESLPDYPERIDVRSPAEFGIDHVPGAVNLPVLSDDERKVVGTLHSQESAFAARKLGAALVARNIGRILETHCAAKPRDWAPVVYCWRGGKRSASLAHVQFACAFSPTNVSWRWFARCVSAGRARSRAG